jgi:hypothetical protein
MKTSKLVPLALLSFVLATPALLRADKSPPRKKEPAQKESPKDAPKEPAKDPKKEEAKKAPPPPAGW